MIPPFHGAPQAARSEVRHPSPAHFWAWKATDSREAAQAAQAAHLLTSGRFKETLPGYHDHLTLVGKSAENHGQNFRESLGGFPLQMSLHPDLGDCLFISKPTLLTT